MKALQIWHLLTLGLAISAYGMLMAVSESQDSVRELADSAAIIGGAIYGALSFIAIVLWGEGATFRSRLISAYRRLMTNRAFLAATSTVLTIVVLTFVWQLAAYRQVEFIVNDRCEVLLSDRVGQMSSIGIFAAETVLRRRISVGSHLIATKLPSGHAIVSVKKIVVNPVWSHAESERYDFNCRPERKHEYLSPTG